MKVHIWAFIILSFPQMLVAQPDTAIAVNTGTSPGLSLAGYLEPYYCFDFSNPENHQRAGFLYNYNRHNEVSLNLGFVKASYLAEGTRANFALMTGTYAQSNLAAEPGIFQMLFEANAGLKLSKKRELWLDAGIMPSHIGFESAIGKDNWTLTRSLLAENSPYYETGAKLSYTSVNGRWYLAFLYLNGWQRIARPIGNSSPAFGAQVTFKPKDRLTVNWSAFAGNDKPDATKQWRYFNNFYGIVQLTDRLEVTAGVDIGVEEAPKGEDGAYNLWYSPVVITRFAVAGQLNLGMRLEYYSDEDGVIIATGTPGGFQTLGYSLNLDYQVSGNALFRLEGRSLVSKDQIFVDGNGASDTNTVLTSSLAFWF